MATYLDGSGKIWMALSCFDWIWADLVGFGWIWSQQRYRANESCTAIRGEEKLCMPRVTSICSPISGVCCSHALPGGKTDREGVYR